MLGTGSYTEVVSAVEELMAGQKAEHFAGINTTYEDGERIVTTPSYTAYLKIAEGCSNGCAFCIIPKQMGRYRSRTMEAVLKEAGELAARGEGADRHCAGHHPVRLGPEGRNYFGWPAAGAVQNGLPLDPPALPVPRGHYG